MRDWINGLLGDDDPGAIARAVERLLLDPSYAARLGAAGAELVRRERSLTASIERLDARLTAAVGR